MNFIKGMIGRTIRMVLKPVFRLAPDLSVNSIFALLNEFSRTQAADKSLKYLLEFDNKLYGLTGAESIRYGKGLHSKHRLINYKEFFISNIRPGAKVLDIGCGIGALAHAIASAYSDIDVFGIDINKTNIEKAVKMHSHNNLRFVSGDALTELPDEEFDYIVLSNVLEHIEHRVDFLKQINTKYAPRTFLIRVPVYDRDWRVPLKDELGIDSRLDPTHYTEYLTDNFISEITQAGLSIERYDIKWGEILAVIIPNKN